MTLKNKIYETLKQRIITNDLHAGQQLYEKQIMQEYGIGRTPLREIFHDLQRDTLIEILPKLGTRVVRMDFKMLRETVQLRRELEGLAAELATQNITKSQLDEFRSLLDGVKKIDKNDPDALTKMSEIDVKLHEMIYLASGNDQLIQTLKTLFDKMVMYWFQIGFSADQFEEQFEELESLYLSMTKGDAEESKIIMKNHISHFAELIKKHFF